MTKIGFVGLGHMGLPMAKNLLKAGFEISAYDLDSKALKTFAQAGGKVCKNLQEVAKDQNIFITMLQTGEQVQAVCLGKDGLFEHAKPGILHIDCSSIAVLNAREIHGEAKALGLLSVDAPVSGGVSGAEAGTLTIMVGGELSSFNQAKPILEAMGKTIIFTGSAGSGQAAKICNNMILGVSMLAISEAFVLAKELGLSAQKLHEVVNHASGQCWAMSKYVPVAGIVGLENVPANKAYKPGFTANMMLKDLNLSQQAAEVSGVSTPVAKRATDLYKEFVENGGGDLDFSGIITMLEQTEK